MNRDAASPASESFEPDVEQWDAWRPEEIARRLTGVTAPWYVAAGWSIDLFLGEERREHEDLEIAVPHDRFGEIAAALDDLAFFVVGDGVAWPLAHAGERYETEHQTWGREPATGLWRLDVFREPADGQTWICRRDERIRLPYDRVIAWTDAGIPYCRPEIALLFKAKGLRPRDESDFSAALPRMDSGARQWLAEALALVQPEHPWLAELRSAEDATAS